jgi:MFS family permease
VGRYLSVLRRRAALLPFVAAVVGRLPVAMAPLGLVLLIQGVRGAYAFAGVVTAAYALGAAVSAPGWGHLMDRYGQSLVVGPVSVVSGVLLAVLALTAVGGGGDVLLIALAAAVGLTFPPLSPAMRGAWRAALDSDLDRRAAYALDAVAVETIFVGGPLLLAVLLPFGAVVPLVVTAVLLGVGGGSYALTGAARAWRPEPSAVHGGGRGESPLRVPGVRLVLAVAIAMAVGFGLTDVSIAATAREDLHDQARIGFLFAAIAGGSATGGLWYGSRVWHRPEHLRLPVSLGGFVVGLVVLGSLLSTGHPGLGTLLPVLFGTGLCIAPVLIILANLVDHHGPDDRLSEAQSWLNTAFTAGSAGGTALAGIAVDTGGPGRGFLGAAAAVAVGLVGSLAAARAWRG